MLLLDVTHTSHTASRTGIQRVVRALVQHLGETAVSVTRDPFLGGWRAIEPWERVRLADSVGREQGAVAWPAWIKWRGRVRRTLGRTSAHAIRGEFGALLEPELFGPGVARELPKLFSQVRGPRVALFLDAIALRFPELSPAPTVARFPAYMHELLRFDGIAAISADSRDSLLGYWQWLGITNPPPVIALPLGVDPVVAVKSVSTPTMRAHPVVLAVGTIEGRKNHRALLEACEQLWSGGRQFTLRMIGHVNGATGSAAFARLKELQTAGRPIVYDGPSSDEAIAQAYTECAFTVYPSVCEGFGLPVIESLVRGKPCICSARGALGEISRDGGCLALDDVSAPSLALAIDRLLGAPDERVRLGAEAAQRRFKTWGAYTQELTEFVHSLPRRA